MMIQVTRPGLQTTIQASPRNGMRHLGVPMSGPADALSMALANHLLGNNLLAPALESTLTGVDLLFESDTWFAIAGAPCEIKLSGGIVEAHTTIRARAGDELKIGSAILGARTYVAFAGGLLADEVLGSVSTYLPASIGGFKGRALEIDDRLLIGDNEDVIERSTPEDFRPPFSGNRALRATVSADWNLLTTPTVFQSGYAVGNRADRMGIQLEGVQLEVGSGGRLASAPVFPGCVQCPEDGKPFILSVDAQTTGGYPRIAHIIRADRHLLGQLRPATHMTLIERDLDAAHRELLEKQIYWRQWLPGIERVI